MTTWPERPKQGECWITSECGRWRILKAVNRAPKSHDGWPPIEPVVYVLWMADGLGKWRIVKSCTSLEEAKHEADSAQRS